MDKIVKYTLIGLIILILSFGFITTPINESPFAQASTVQVGPGQTYLTIQEGIDAANPGDTVFVHEGIYYETITINKTINLTGENKDTTIIDGMNSSFIIWIEEDFINISCFTIRYGANGICIFQSNQTKINGNIIHNISTLGEGITVLGSYNNITNNTFINVYSGISFWDLSDNGIAYNNSFNNCFGGIGSSGSNITIINNQINNGTGGIGIIGINNYISNNHIYNVTNGFSIFNSPTINNIFYNNIIENVEEGISIRLASNNTFYNCSIINSTSYGIWLDRSQGCEFINCSILNSNTTDIQFYKSNATFVNTSFDRFKVKFNGNDSALTVQWYLQVLIKDLLGNPIPNAPVQVFNATDDLAASGITDQEGFLKWIAVTERIQNYTTNITHTPHNVTASKDSYTGYAIPEPLMDCSKQVNITIPLPLPLHHIKIIPVGPDTYYIGDSTTYTAVGWNDAQETQLNTSWVPLWSVDNTSVASIDSGSGLFSALALGSSAVNVTSALPTGIFATSSFSVEPWPLHHIILAPQGPESYYIGERQVYTAKGYNDAGETQENTTWTPIWSVNEPSLAYIDPDTGEFTALALGSGAVNVSDITLPGIFAASAFTVLPYPLHHIDITQDSPVRFYINDEMTFMAVSWNDENHSQQNMTWSPQWSLSNTIIATIDSNTGEFMALALGEGKINVTAAGYPGIYKTMSFTIEPWPLHHLEIIPGGPESYYIGGTRTYVAVGWNDAQETQLNTSWTPVWNVDDTSLAAINSSSGEFSALALGSGSISVSAASLPQISNTSSFSVQPWPLHHISISPASTESHEIGDTVIYSAIGWNDVEETQVNTTWIRVWSLEGGLEGLTLEGENARFEAKKSGEGLIRCTDETTGTNASLAISVKSEVKSQNAVWLWLLIPIIIVIIIIVLWFIFKKHKKQKDESLKPL